MDNLRILLCRESQDMGSFFAKFTTASGRGEDNHRDRFSDHSVTLPFRVTDDRVPAAPESPVTLKCECKHKSSMNDKDGNSEF